MLMQLVLPTRLPTAWKGVVCKAVVKQTHQNQQPSRAALCSHQDSRIFFSGRQQRHGINSKSIGIGGLSLERLVPTKALGTHRRLSWWRLRSLASVTPLQKEESKEQGIANRTELGFQVVNKPELCTADELHYCYVPKSNWRLALWRYVPPPEAPRRNHPVIMLSGVAANAFTYDLDPQVSLARHLAELGFDSWICEVRGMGLSQRVDEASGQAKDMGEIEAEIMASSSTMLEGNSQSIAKLNENGDMALTEGALSNLKGLRDEVGGLLEDKAKEGPWSAVEELRDRLGSLLNGGRQVRMPSGEPAADPRQQQDPDDRDGRGWKEESNGSAREEAQTGSKGLLTESNLASVETQKTGLEEDTKEARDLVKQMEDLRGRLDSLLASGKTEGLTASITELRDRLSILVGSGGVERLQQQQSSDDVAGRSADVAESADVAGKGEEGDGSSVGEAVAVAEEGAVREGGVVVQRRLGPLQELRERLGGILEERQTQALRARVDDLRSRLGAIMDESQRADMGASLAELRERVGTLLDERVSGTASAAVVADVRKQFTAIIEEAQKRVPTAPNMSEIGSELSGRLESVREQVAPRVASVFDASSVVTTVFEDAQRTLANIGHFDWDFDTYLEEDIPAAVSYIRNRSSPPDGKLLGIGHSMGGILLYASISTQGDKCPLAAAVAVGSAIDYSKSNSILKLLLPLVSPARMVRMPLVIPLGILSRLCLPLILRPPYTLSFLKYQVSAPGMMDAEMLKKLFTCNFCTIPVKLLLHMSSVFDAGGIRSRDSSVAYGQGLRDCRVPVLALAGDRDTICPPVAVTETAEMFPEDMVTLELLGGPSGRHYGHYDFISGRHARQEVYPLIEKFLLKNDIVDL